MWEEMLDIQMTDLYQEMKQTLQKQIVLKALEILKEQIFK